jgi:hypothetical protein
MEGSPAQQILAGTAALVARRAVATALAAIGLPHEEALAALLGNSGTTAFMVRAGQGRRP